MSTRTTNHRYEIISRNGTHRSFHKTREAAEKQHQRNLAWRCGICGNIPRGYARCSHGSHNQVCSAEHYNDCIIDRACSRCGTITSDGGYCKACAAWLHEHECGICRNHVDALVGGLCKACAEEIKRLEREDYENMEREIKESERAYEKEMRTLLA